MSPHRASGSETRPRRPVFRHGLTILGMVVLWAPAAWAHGLLSDFLREQDYFSGNYLLSDTLTLLPWAFPALLLLPAVRAVGYRKRDVLFCFLPMVNGVFTVRICWRVAGLPHVDWPRREDGNVKGASGRRRVGSGFDRSSA